MTFQDIRDFISLHQSIKMMFIKRISLILIFCASGFMLGAQKTYLWNSSGKLDMPSYYEMYMFDIQTGDRQVLFRLDSTRFVHPNMTGNTFLILSFAFSTDRKTIYFLEREGDLYSYDIASDIVKYIKDLTPGNLNYLWHNFHQTHQIDQLNDSLYYIGGATKGILNINNFQVSIIREIPSFAASATNFERLMYIRKLEKHKDQHLILDGNVYLANVDLYDPQNNTIAINQDLTYIGYFDDTNLLSYQYACDSTVLYTIQNVFYQGERDTIQIDRVDLSTGQITRWKNYLGLTSSNFSTNRIRDIQHINDRTWESCQRYIDLDKNDNTASDRDFLIDSLCAFTHIPMSDLDIHINNEYPIDSIDIFILDPRFSQYMNFPNGNYFLKTSSNFWQRIINNGSTTILEFEDAIRNAYLDIDNDPSVTEVKIGFQVWYNGLVGDTAIATLKIAGPLPYAGMDISRSYCDGDTSISLAILPEESADQGGTFYDADFNTLDHLKDINAPIDDIIYYETSNGICYDTAQISLSIKPGPSISKVEDAAICFDDLYIADITVENNTTLTWFDGLNDSLRIFTEAGIYSYQIANQYGCTVADTFTISVLPPAINKIIYTQLCEGQTYTNMSKIYAVPGYYLDTLRSSQGCDSVYLVLDLMSFPVIPLVVEGDFDVCAGNTANIIITSPHDQLKVDGVNSGKTITITESGTYIISGIDQNGCLQEKEITIISHPVPEVFAVDMIDTVFMSGLKLPVSYDGDIESYRWSPANHLDCDDCPYPVILAPHDGIYTVSVEDINGCKNEAHLRVSFRDATLFVPNIIANHATDPENSIFYIKGNQSSAYTLAVYDRWGNLIFHRKDAQVNNREQGWNPQGKVVAGVYIYLISYMDNGKEKTLYGSVTVID